MRVFAELESLLRSLEMHRHVYDSALRRGARRSRPALGLRHGNRVKLAGGIAETAMRRMMRRPLSISGNYFCADDNCCLPVTRRTGGSLSSGRPYTEGAKRSAIQYAEEQLREGVLAAYVAKEIGIAPATFASWLSVSPLVPVRITRAASIPQVVPALVLTDVRRNLRVDGLTMEDLVTIFERLQ